MIMTSFADQLLEDLMREHGHELHSAPSPRRRAVRPAWVTAGLAAAAAATVGGFVLFGGSAAPAYAVTQHADGTVSVSVSQPSAINAANAKLRAIGVRAVIVPVRAGCPSFDSVTVKTRPGASVSTTVRLDPGNGRIAGITVNAKGVPAGETMVLAFGGTSGDTFGVSGFVQGAVPHCISLPTPTGGGN
jgi:hypothetical protein